MSYGKLNIWLRDLNCCPKNVWKVELVVKTCGGEYLVDFNPDVIDKLKGCGTFLDILTSRIISAIREICHGNGVKSTFDPCLKLLRVKSRLYPLNDPLNFSNTL